MPKYTNNLGLIMPKEKEYFNISSWNTNMRVLDEAYALLSDESGATKTINALSVSYNPSTSGLSATNVQTAIDSLGGSGGDSYTLYDVTEPLEIQVPTEGHLYVVLAFGATAYSVTFTTEAGKSINYEGGTPYFDNNNVYELSFLNLDCRWFKRKQ